MPRIEMPKHGKALEDLDPVSWTVLKIHPILKTHGEFVAFDRNKFADRVNAMLHKFEADAEIISVVLDTSPHCIVRTKAGVFNSDDLFNETVKQLTDEAFNDYCKFVHKMSVNPAATLTEPSLSSVTRIKVAIAKKIINILEACINYFSKP